ncbi:unnamed protein product [Brassica rapa]|uniref:CG-1 domain-containing protein n=1 Tax=Brassica campestris TaxID=3711 RepID=A0A8D9I025_BRACM|nr:unnamed protein product [Brassica rapa]
MVKEAHEKLKVGSIDVLHCYYAHGEDNENFQRRCYSMHLAVLKVLPLPFLGNRDGWIHGNRVKENNSQRLVGVPALDASFENPLARYQNLPYNPLLTQANPSNAGLVSVEGHLRNPLQNQEIGRIQFRTAFHCKNGPWTPMVLTWPYMRISRRFRVLSTVKTSSSLLGVVFKLRFHGFPHCSLSTVSIILGIDVLLAMMFTYMASSCCAG